MSLKDTAKAALGRLLADYRINWIYAGGPWCAGRKAELEVAPIDAAMAELLAASPTAKMRNSLSYTRGGLTGLVLVENGKPVCVSHVADPAHYDRSATWPLRANEVAVMDLATEDALKGRGLAVQLMQATTSTHLAHGKSRVIAFIWWNNTPSVRAVTKAGWRRIGLSIEVQIARKWFALRLPLPLPP